MITDLDNIYEHFKCSHQKVMHIDTFIKILKVYKGSFTVITGKQDANHDIFKISTDDSPNKNIFMLIKNYDKFSYEKPNRYEYMKNGGKGLFKIINVFY